MKTKTLLALLLSGAVMLPAVNFAAVSHSSTKAKVTQSAVVNINQADIKTLSNLKDIGLKKAEYIVAYRTKNGAFKSLNDLTKVKGISERIIKDNQGKLKLK